MIQVDVQQVQANFPRYLEQVANGATIVVCKDNKAVAEIRPINPAPHQQPRPLGLAQGMGTILPNAFEPLPDEILDAFEGKQE